MVDHITYESYDFETDPNADLEALITEYHDMFTYADAHPDVRGAWVLEKPVSKLEIMPDPAHDRVSDFLEKFSAYFYWEFDGFNLYFSRFPELPALANQIDTPEQGILFGYCPRDVAQYISERKNYDFRTESDNGGNSAVDEGELIAKRDKTRTALANEDLYDASGEASNADT